MITLSEAQAQRLIQLYTDAETEILKEYNKALLKGNDLKNLESLKRNIGIIRQDLLNGGRTWCEQAVPMIYKTAAIDVDGALGMSGFGFGGVHQRAMQVLAENTYQHFVDVDQVIGRRAEDVYRNLSLEAIRGDIAGWETWKQTAKAYREKLAEKGVTGFKDATGRDWDLTRYTEMVARTTTRECMIEGTSNRLLEHGHDLAEIIGGTSKKTCRACRNWVGRTVSLTGKTSGYPTLADARGAGVFHGNCTHNIATAMTFESEIAKAEGRKIGDAKPEEFIEARDKLPADLRAFLTPYTAEEYRAANVKLAMHESGNGGYGLKGDELISVFSLPGAHLGNRLVKGAIANGAKRLDCLGEELVNLYKRNGFKIIKTDKWDDRFAPKDWNYMRFGRPNLYYMER